jgi:hypothetical protein
MKEQPQRCTALAATPGHSLWIWDTGAGSHIVSESDVTRGVSRTSTVDVEAVLCTAVGLSKADAVVTFGVAELGSKTEVATILHSTPRVLSAGVSCMEGGCDFVWNGSRGERPYVVLPEGENGVRKRVWLGAQPLPYLRSQGTALPAAPAGSADGPPLEEGINVDYDEAEYEAHDVVLGGEPTPFQAGTARR